MGQLSEAIQVKNVLDFYNIDYCDRDWETLV